MDEYPYRAYYLRYGTRYTASFCHAEDAERFLESGEEWEHLAGIGLEPEPDSSYIDEGHLCWGDDCPKRVAARDAAFEAHAAVSLALANEE